MSNKPKPKSKAAQEPTEEISKEQLAQNVKKAAKGSVSVKVESDEDVQRRKVKPL